MKYNSAYSPKVRTKTMFLDKSLTKQSEFDQADINQIIKRHMNPTMLADLNKLEQIYGEITSTDLLEAHQKLEDAEEAFMEIPSEIRRKFNQDAGEFIDFATDPENIDQMREWGLAKPKEADPVIEPENPPEINPEEPPIQLNT